MRAYRLLLVMVAALVLAAVSMQAVVHGAQVTKIIGRRGHIYIDGGKDAGFLMGSKVCFYLFSGEQILCGIVRQTSPTRAMVKVKNREAKRIKKGMTAKLMTGDGE